MKKTLYYLFATVILLSATSCDFLEDGNSKFEKAIASQDFDAAHQYFSKNKSKKNAETLFRAETAFLMSHGESEKIATLATELGVQNLYKTVLAENIPLMIRQKKFDEAIELLTAWPFEYTFNKEALSVRDEEFSTKIAVLAEKKSKFEGKVAQCNVEYNEEMRQYNAILDNIVAAAILDKDKDLIRKCIKLYGPNAVLKSKTETSSDFWDNKTYNAVFELKYLDRDDAKKEVAAAGIRL